MDGAAQPAYPDDTQPVAADAVDPSAHLDQTFGEVGDLGLARGVDQHGFALGQCRRHQQILGGADRDDRKDDFGAAQPLWRARVDITLVQFDLRAEPAQPGDMQVDRPRADRAPAGQ